MTKQKLTHPTLITATLLVALVTGCDNRPAGANNTQTNHAQTRITGHVLNDDGPITQGKVEAKDAKGAIAARTELKGQSSYVLSIPAGTAYPLTMTAYPEAAPNESLRAVITDANASMQDISPLTTIVVDTAMSLGGLTEANLAKAAVAAISQRKKSGSGSGAGGSSESFTGDPTKQYGGWH